MAPAKRKQPYDNSDTFVARSSTSPPPAQSSTRPSKRAKPITSTTSSGPPNKQVDADGNPYWPISTTRRVTISDFKGKKMVSVREYYEKDGTWLPGKKGITMTVEQYNELVGLLPQIEKALGKDGETVRRPDYGGGDGTASAEEEEEEDVKDEDDEDEDGDTNGRHAKKANIDATSDEDEG